LFLATTTRIGDVGRELGEVKVVSSAAAVGVPALGQDNVDMAPIGVNPAPALAD